MNKSILSLTFVLMGCGAGLNFQASTATTPSSPPSATSQETGEQALARQAREMEAATAQQRRDSEALQASRTAQFKIEQDARDRVVAEDQRKMQEQSDADTKRLKEACSATYPQRFAARSVALRSYAQTKAKWDAECKALSRHCVTASNGTSFCSGLTPEQRDTFSGFCQLWPHYSEQISEHDDECADVDPEPLRYDYSMSNADAAALAKKRAP